MRGLITRPTADEVAGYRADVDRAVESLLSDATDATLEIMLPILEIGLYHEQQHQELLLTDILHAFAQNPLSPVYDAGWRFPRPVSRGGASELRGGVAKIGHEGEGFSFDNESPRHETLILPCRIDKGLVTNAQWLAFIEDGGYARPELWLSDGWLAVQAEGWEAPGYWQRNDAGQWSSMTFAGQAGIDPALPVTHVSYFEADAFARWAGRDLPTEFEWRLPPRRAFSTTLSASSGNGPARPICPTRATGRCPVRSANTTASSCRTSSFCAVPRWRHRKDMPHRLSQLLLSPPALAIHGTAAVELSRLSIVSHTCVTQRPLASFGDLPVTINPVFTDATPLSAVSSEEQFRDDVLVGLTAAQKFIPAKYFYDEVGSDLFEAITRQPEYYPTRTEIGILDESGADIASLLPPRANLVEFGSGSTVKVRRLLVHLTDLAAYVPVDVSESFLRSEAETLSRDFPRLSIQPVAADFTRPFTLPDGLSNSAVAGFFPGSTIGNFEPPQAAHLLAHFGRVLGRGASLVVGVDLVKDKSVLDAAYDDAAGVTARFNINLLHRINRELGADFDPSAFAHRAYFAPEASRIEMHLVSLRAQQVSLAGRRFSFSEEKRSIPRTATSTRSTASATLPAKPDGTWLRAGPTASACSRSMPSRADKDQAFFSSICLTCISWSQTVPGVVPSTSKPALMPQ